MLHLSRQEHQFNKAENNLDFEIAKNYILWQRKTPCNTRILKQPTKELEYRKLTVSEKPEPLQMQIIQFLKISLYYYSNTIKV